MIKSIKNLGIYNSKVISTSLVIILGFLIGILSATKPVIAIALAVLPFLLININFKSYLFFSLIVSQTFVGIIGMFVPIQMDFGTIDNAYKALVFTGFGLLLIYVGLMKKRRIIKTNYLVVFFISVIYFLFSSISASSPTDSLYILKIIVPPLLFVVVAMNYERIDWKKVNTWVIVFVFLNLVMCLYQVSTGSGASADIARGSGLTPSRNTFSMYLVFLFDFILILSLLLNKKKFSVLLISSIVLMEFLSYGRAGWGILAVTICLSLLAYKKIKILIFSLILMSVTAYGYWDKIQLRFQSGEGTSEHRELMADLLIYYGKQQPFSGYGFGWAQEFLIRNPHISGRLIQPHNDYVRLFVDTGLIGLALFLIPFVIMAFRSMKLTFIKDKKVKQIAFVTLLSILQVLGFMMVYNTIDMYFASTMMAWLFMVILEMEYLKYKNKSSDLAKSDA